MMQRSRVKKSVLEMRRDLPWIPIYRFPDRILQGQISSAVDAKEIFFPNGTVGMMVQAYSAVNAGISWAWGGTPGGAAPTDSVDERGLQLNYSQANSLLYATENHQSIIVRTTSATAQLFNVLCWLGSM